MSSDFLEAANLFTWSVWGEIGVPSQERRLIEMAIDLEPLVRLTDAVGRNDPRLRSHAAAWLDASPELVSRARLKRLDGGEPDVLGRPGRATAMSGRAAPDVASASAIQLRIRSALGVSARAEIIRQFVLDRPGTRRSASELGQLCGYTKRNVEKALEALERGGWVMRIRGGTSLRWSVDDHAALAGLFSPLPSSNASFLALAQIVENLLSLDDIGSAGGQVRSAAARQLLAEQQTTADWGGVTLPKVPSTDDAWVAISAWVADLPAAAL